MIPLILDEFDKVKNKVTSEEVARARAQLKASLLMGLESTSSRCEQLAQHMLIFGRPIPTFEIIKKVEAVDEAAVIRVARRLIKGTPTITAIGPTRNSAIFKTIETRLAS